MYIVGLTGGIASGKSTVSSMLAALGVDIIDADQVYHDLLSPGGLIWQDITQKCGSDILDKDGQIQRQRLAERVFGDSDFRAWLESVTHPRVQARVSENLRQAELDGCRLVVLDVPLLLEAGWQHMVNELWVVYVPPQVQADRLMKRSGLTAEQAVKRIQAQWALSEKVKYADYVIDNTGSREETKQQVLDLWDRVCLK